MTTTALQEVLGESLEAQAATTFKLMGLDLITEIRMFISQALADGMPDWEYRMQPNGTIYRYAPKNRTTGWLKEMATKDSYKAFDAVKALESASKKAQSNGTANMTLEAINDEIAAYRAGR